MQLQVDQQQEESSLPICAFLIQCVHFSSKAAKIFKISRRGTHMKASLLDNADNSVPKISNQSASRRSEKFGTAKSFN
jgi:hypothetical protein